mgnify:CR=1 FL=1
MFTACKSAYDFPENETVEVTFSINGQADSKADSPLIPDIENLIYDVWILQYDKMGLLIDAGTSHQRITASGSLMTTVTTDLAVGDGCTICILANLDRGNTTARTWPQTLTEFKTSVEIVALQDKIEKANNGTLTEMPMFGYWEGNIDNEIDNIRVSLGRMLCRINLVINNTSAAAKTILKLDKVSVKGYAFPRIHHNPLPDDSYSTIEINKSVAAGKSSELYFYTAPNFAASETNATKLVIDGKTVILSNDPPSQTTNRDYNLYHNSNYTFTININ